MHRRIVFACLAAVAAHFAALPARAQQLDDFDRRRIGTMLEVARDAIAEHYYDSTYHGLDLAARYDTAAARIRAATDIDRALAAVAQFALDLHDSHTFFVPPQRTVSAEYGWDMAMVGDTCFVVAVNAGSDAARQGVHTGDAVLAVGGYVPTRDNLWQLLYLYRVVRPQRSLRTTLRAPGAAPRTLDLAATIREGKRILDVTGMDGGDDIMRLIRDAEKTGDEVRDEVVDVGDSTLVWRFPTFAVAQREIDDVVDRARRKRTSCRSARQQRRSGARAHRIDGPAQPRAGHDRHRARASRTEAAGRAEGSRRRSIHRPAHRARRQSLRLCLRARGARGAAHEARARARRPHGWRRDACPLSRPLHRHADRRLLWNQRHRCRPRDDRRRAASRMSVSCRTK